MQKFLVENAKYYVVGEVEKNMLQPAGWPSKATGKPAKATGEAEQTAG